MSKGANKRTDPYYNSCLVLAHRDGCPLGHCGPMEPDLVDESVPPATRKWPRDPMYFREPPAEKPFKPILATLKPIPE